MDTQPVRGHKFKLCPPESEYAICIMYVCKAKCVQKLPPTKIQRKQLEGLTRSFHFCLTRMFL